MKRSGFTLAEVLITLGIIGVVAAMTIPNLIANINAAHFRSQFKKTISTLNQAGLMAQAKYGFDYAGTRVTCAYTPPGTAPTEYTGYQMSFCTLLNSTLTGQTWVGSAYNLKLDINGSEFPYNMIKRHTLSHHSRGYYAYTLADGTIVAFDLLAKECELPIGTQMTNEVLEEGGILANCIGFIDVNGVNLPNEEVSCTATNSATKNVQTPCFVKNDSKHMTDIFPIVFHDATVEPASDAAKYVFTSSK